MPNPGTARFEPRLSIFKLLANEQIYRYTAFYDVKSVLMRFDERTDYCNYGYWKDGAATQNPSAELVQLVAGRLGLTGKDVLLNVGSGTGQPDVDIARCTPVRRIIGVNICVEQVAHANQKARDEGLADRIEHRVLPADQIASLAGEGITSVMCLESLAEMADYDAVLRACLQVLPAGGRVALCDVSRGTPAPGQWLRRVAGAALRFATSPLWDHWRSGEAYADSLCRHGARDVVVESIGDWVYPQLCREAIDRFPQMRQADHIPRRMRMLARLKFVSLRAFHEWRQLDYVVVSGRK